MPPMYQELMSLFCHFVASLPYQCVCMSFVPLADHAYGHVRLYELQWHYTSLLAQTRRKLVWGTN